MKRSRIVRKLTFALLSAVLLAMPAAFGLSFVPVSDETLADQAAVIVHGRVLGASVQNSARGAVTEYRVEAIETFKGGVARGSVLSVQIPGGTLADGTGRVIWGMPKMASGEEALLFLRPDGSSYRIAQMVQGVFRATHDAGELFWQRQAGGASPKAFLKMLPKSDSLTFAADHYTSARHAERFSTWLADRAAGTTRAADYFADGAQTAPAFPPSKFTLISLDPRIRWFEFDDGMNLEWSRHTGGQDGSADRGVAAFRRARRAWNGEPNSPIRIVEGPETSSTTGFGSSDLRNTFLFQDFNDDIDGDFSCSGGGVLAIGGISFIRGGGFRRAWKGEQYAVAVEAEIIVNDGTECFAVDRVALEQVYAHEFGHTLGFGHSCGDDFSPACAGNPALDGALMRAAVRSPFFGAELQADDIAAARFLYDPTFFDQLPGDTGTCNLPEGHPRFCTDCGPCNAGQGDCDRDADCASGLSCVDDRGADFGFAPGIDVCLADGGGGGGGGGDPNCPVPLGSGRYCEECGPCTSGQGDCDGDGECAPGFQCVDNVGAQFGFDPRIDVCLPGPPGPCTSENGRGDFCAVCGPCGSGEGDCDSDAECQPGLVCVDDIGPQFGFGPRVDVCQ